MTKQEKKNYRLHCKAQSAAGLSNDPSGNWVSVSQLGAPKTRAVEESYGAQVDANRARNGAARRMRGRCGGRRAYTA